MYAAVYLSGNNLTRFESAVYQPVLEQQALVGVDNGGFFLLSGSILQFLTLINK